MLLGNVNTIFLRNIIIFCVFLGLCLTALGFIVVSQAKKVDHTDDQVEHTHYVINESQNLSANIAAMLANQRGYLIVPEAKFKIQYVERKALVSKNIATLKELSADNPSQVSRVEELQHTFLKFADLLESTAGNFQGRVKSTSIDNLDILDNLSNEIGRINNDLLTEEYGLLNQRISLIERQRNQYILTFIIGGLVTGLVLLVLNWFLFRAQSRRGIAERNLRETEERLILALQGTNDGIYDWNIKTGQVVYSEQFWHMLGYEADEFRSTYESYRNLVHSDDIKRVEEHIENYLSGIVSEYSIAFRMRNSSGQWVWINSRGKAVFDKNGKPARMVGAHTDINHIKAYEERLKEAKEKAESASRAKTEFLAHMSHEIRTPLTAISGIAEILEKNIHLYEERQKKLIVTLGNSTEMLSDLVNDILDFSKIESGQIELESRPVSLAELAQQVISIMAVKANEKGLKFEFDLKGIEDLVYQGDKVRLRQILINLVGNAIKFTEEGSVKVQAGTAMWQEKPALRIDVKDTGIGIETKNIDIIFERFKQADSSVSRKFGGSGLGLPISKSLARLMGGDILVSSEPNKGSIFSLILPVSDGMMDVVPAVEPARFSPSERTKIPGNEHNKILLVEDYEGNIVMLSYILEAMGCTFDIARTGLQAVEHFKEGNYDLVLMDIQMPEMDGLTATREIRKWENEQGFKNKPVIGMTAHATAGDREVCLDAGMDAYLPKPIIEADLEHLILKLLEQSKKAA